MPLTTQSRTLAGKWLLAIGAPLVVLAAGEFVLFLLGAGAPQRSRTFGNFSLGLAWTHTPEPPILETHPSRLYTPIPQLRGVARTDRHGFRGPDRPERHEHLVRIAIVGDSTVFGFGVAYGDSFVGATASSLRARHPRVDVDVIAAACHGYSSLQNRLDLDDRVLPLRPDVVVLCLAGFNDSVGALEMDDEAWSKVGPTRETKLGRLLARSRIANLIRGVATEPSPAASRSAESAPPGAIASPPRRVGVEKYDANVRAMIDRIRAAGAIPVLMTHAFRADAVAEDPYRGRYRAALESIAAERSIPLVNGAAALEDGASRFYFDRIHPTEEGHARLAAALAESLSIVARDLLEARAGRDDANTPAITPPPGPDGFVLTQFEPMTLAVIARAGADESPRFFVGGTPADDVARDRGEFRLTLPPLPRGEYDLEIATLHGSARVANGVRVRGPELSIRLDGAVARVVVTSGSLAARASLHVATERGAKPMMLRRTFELKDGAALGSPLPIPLTADSSGRAVGSFDAPLREALATYPRLYLQAIVEPDPERAACAGEFAIAWPTNVVELAR